MFGRNGLRWSRQANRSTPWHRSDPRVRLFCTLVLSCLALASRPWQELAFVYLCLAVVHTLSRTPWKTAWSGFRPFFILLLFTALLQLFFTPGKPIPLFGSYGPSVSREGIQLSIVILCRLSALILLSTHLIATTSPFELSKSLGWALSPAGRIGFPVSDAVLLLNLGFQFFPLLLEESHSLHQALESRGISIRHQRLTYRLRALTAWILALLTAIIERSHRLAIALEIKNFHRHSYLRLRFPVWRHESSLLLSGAAAAAVAWTILRFSGAHP